MGRKKGTKVFSFAVKQKIISELDQGLLTASEVMEKYDIKSRTTFSNFRKQLKKGYRPQRYFEPELKIKHVAEIISGIRTIEEVQKLLDVDSKWQILAWVEKYRYSSDEISNSEQMKTPSKFNPLDEELKQARLQILALESMISIAEKQLNYPIRKKFGTKQ